ncbi:SOS response-associated peptidase [Salinimicrobium sp. MT39]|uniref:Abasic site processing protein n=1 Tax=Salinimicrobium profundisediminis TaxID=2994553 RepID=A0A9X3I1M0_9FLAO|nr:SOS response-associated peptidase [Salinimicrobium profundisediminis]MCX2839091.1 SOS response-associated peptidase [Salinimicrobium profundisediminis]
MCYRTKLNSKLQEIESSFEAVFIDPDSYIPKEEINGFAHHETPVITDENPQEITLSKWGLIPFWAKSTEIQKSTLNAKIETAQEKPSFQKAVNNRCLVIADGYYEWQWLDAKGGIKQKYLIRTKDQSVFAFAGIYSYWKEPATNYLHHTYSILTTEANELMSRIHNNKRRMPVVLEKRDQRKWLDGTDLSKFAFPYEVALTATPVDEPGKQQALNF